MDVVTLVLVLLLAVVVSAFAGRLLPGRLPAPLVQIALGAGLSWAGFQVAFDPELFLLLFIPPLLFLDGWRIPKGAFFQEWRPILALAIGLVVFTVLGIGYFVHWLIPALPLAVAFALAAILSPTDPVAVSAMTATAPLPSRLMHILEGEALLNDATGLVCFSFAVTAAVSGGFSLGAASLSFLMVAGGGVLVGLVVTVLIGRINHWLVRRTAEDPGTQILVSLLIPFAAYLTAEEVHVSGILAAAVAGIAMHYTELSGRPQAATRMQRNAVWNTVQTTLNGLIFVLLGEQMPALAARLPEAASDAGSHIWLLLLKVLAITLALAALRFLWVWVSIHVTLLRGARKGNADTPKPSLRLLAVAATAGVRGAITLAGVLTLPLLGAGGQPFPGRDLAIFIAMGVILLSLICAAIGLPWLARGLAVELPANPTRDRGEARARAAAAEAALRRLDQLLAEPLADADAAAIRAEAGLRLQDAYRQRLDYGEAPSAESEAAQRVEAAARQLRLQTLRAERDALYQLRRRHAIDDEVHRVLLREIDLSEARLLPYPAAH